MVLVAAYAINLDTTIVNVALPTLNVRLGAGTSSLQWVVDGYNLAFAALVLAGGNIGDRYGRRETLSAGLGSSPLASVVAALCTSVGELIAVRFAMGAAAALIFPTTLSIITNTFPDRKARAAAIGAWGAVTGMGVATGPIIGGALLEHFWWGSVFVALVPVAVVAMVGAWLVVPRSRLTTWPRSTAPGWACRSSPSAALIYTIIEAPDHGGARPRTIGRRSWPPPWPSACSCAGSAAARPHARRPPLHQPAVLGGQRLGDGGVLLAVRLHLPDHPVLPAAARLQPVVDRACASCRWPSASPSRRSSAPS